MRHSNARMAIKTLDSDEKNTLEISEGIPNRGNPNMIRGEQEMMIKKGTVICNRLNTR